MTLMELHEKTRVEARAWWRRGWKHTDADKMIGEIKKNGFLTAWMRENIALDDAQIVNGALYVCDFLEGWMYQEVETSVYNR